ncbi:MAG: hypothetical protein K9M49_08720 [Candidatus Marinimicrobia bacterium]|nr:hypothetical protein [Candidatus Neomarinimicrobiota bacterium]MCF7851284.1 hypothetical protein [Candidatus Neomarinimicrobiota bacterium]MCF7905219.1 hypothetical protein [Candidatus Neomarinimicrobiota bacterium]
MLETQLYFNFKDLFRAPRLAFGRRTLVILEALLASYVIQLILTYVALLAEGNSFGSIWNDFHLLPALFSCPASGIGKFFVGLGRISSLILVILGMTAVAKITIKEFKGNLFYSSKDGWRWAFNNWFPVFFGPISIAIIITFFVILAAFMGWLAQWPVLDILIYGLLFAIFLPTALFLVFSCLALLSGMIMSPSIVACAEEDTMGSMFGAYTLLWNQPVRMITYLAITLATAFIGYHLLYLFILLAYKFIHLVFGQDVLMGNAYLAIRQVGLDLFSDFNFLPSYFEVPNRLTISSGSAVYIAPSATQAISGVLVAFATLIAILSIPAYAISTLATGFATSFIVLTKHKDDQDLIKRRDADERAEEESAKEAEEAQSDPPEEEAKKE